MIARLGDSLAVSKAEVLREAIGILAYMERETRGGARFLILRPGGSVNEMIHPRLDPLRPPDPRWLQPDDEPFTEEEQAEVGAARERLVRGEGVRLSALRPLLVEFDEGQVALLKEMAATEGVTVAHVIRRALGLLRFTQEERAQGHRLVAVSEDGEILTEIVSK